MKQILIVTAVAALLSLGAFFLQCGDGGTGPLDTWEAHEWGVVIVAAGDSNAFVKSIPEDGPPVKEPVIYFQGVLPELFSVKATFHSGYVLVSYPEALVGDTTVEWDSVRPQRLLPVQASTPMAGDPSESVKQILGNVDAASLLYHDSISKFLFYEGQLVFHNQITATWDLDSLMVHLTNNGTYPVHNVTISIDPTPTGQIPVLNPCRARTSLLNPGQTADLLLSRTTSYEFKSDLVSLGFTTPEAVAFDTLWRESSQDPYSQGARASLMYRLPQTVYDDLISLDITPAPNKTIRTLYALVQMYQTGTIRRP